MHSATKYYLLKIKKKYVKILLKTVFWIITLPAIYIILTNFVFITSTNLSYTPDKRYALTSVFENAFGSVVYDCHNSALYAIEQDFIKKHQIFNSNTHSYSYLFDKKTGNCLSIGAIGSRPFIPYLPIWYRDTDPIKVSFSSILILEDSYMFKKILDIAQRPCHYIPSKIELIEFQEKLKTMPKRERMFGSIEQGLFAREALECDVISPKNEEVQLYFHNWDGGKTEVRVTLQRQE